MARDELVFQLGGKSYRQPHTMTIQTATASYGINSLIEQKRFGPQQLMLMDANRVVLPVGDPDWMTHIQERHLGKVNVVTVDGCVRSMTKAQMQDEYLLYEEHGLSSRSLWAEHACPREKH